MTGIESVLRLTHLGVNFPSEAFSGGSAVCIPLCQIVRHGMSPL